MERAYVEVAVNQSLDHQLVYHVIEEAVKAGVREFCLGSGARNMPFLAALKEQHHLKLYFWYEERSAAFFALGRARATKQAVAVVTTSGTAVGELLPAAMEAYYTQDPLLLITADRPKCFRGSGAPQSAEQKGIFGVYAIYQQDLEKKERCRLSAWTKKGPAHLNVCIAEPLPDDFSSFSQIEFKAPFENKETDHFEGEIKEFFCFLKEAKAPFMIVGALSKESKEAICQFLIRLNAPVYLESLSGLREDPRLQHLRVQQTEGLWEFFDYVNYSLDCVIRIGAVPIFRFWRDLENKKEEIKVFSLSEHPFCGLSFSSHFSVCLSTFFSNLIPPLTYPSKEWKNQIYLKQLHQSFQKYPGSEPALFHALSELIPYGSYVYLGNSSPIREWERSATSLDKQLQVSASRGLNGIDGQLSTFLGSCLPGRENWGIFGDLTTLYDLAAFWILQSLESCKLRIVVINNGGGKLFSKMFPHEEMQNQHALDFSFLAAHWKIPYYHWDSIPLSLPQEQKVLIEISPKETFC